MPQFKITLFMNHPRAGWSETFYTLQTTLTPAIAKANLLCIARARLLARPSEFVAYRVAEEGNPRNSVVLPNTQLARFPLPSAEESDTPWQSQLMRLTNLAAGVKRPIYLRGIPDAVWDTGAPGNPIANQWFQTLDNVWSPEVMGVPGGAGNGWYIKSKPLAQGNARIPINTFVGATDDRVSAFTTATAHGAVAGDLVTVYKMPGLNPPMGLCKVLTVSSPLSMTVLFHKPAAYNYAGGAFLVLYTGSVRYTVINGVYYGPINHRDSGRPFGLLRGRRRAVRR